MEGQVDGLYAGCASVGRRGVLLLAVMAVSVAGCSSDWQVRTVTDVGDAISLDMSSCNATYEVTAEETADRVSVTVEQLDAGQATAECADELLVELEAPLGDRAVVINGERREIRHPHDRATTGAP